MCFKISSWLFLTDHVCFVVVELIFTGGKAPVDRNALEATDARSWGVLSQKDESNSYYELGRKSSQCTLEFLDSLYQRLFCRCSWVSTLEPKKRYLNWRGSVFQTETSWFCFTPELRSEEARAAPSRTLTITCGCNSLWWNLASIIFRCESWDLAFRKTWRKALQTSGQNLRISETGWFEQGGVTSLEKNKVQNCLNLFFLSDNMDWRRQLEEK